jgi:hypothetical protein
MQVDIVSDPNDPTSPLVIVSHKTEMETQILDRNRKYSLQALSTPFLHNQELAQLIDPTNKGNDLKNF